MIFDQMLIVNFYDVYLTFPIISIFSEILHPSWIKQALYSSSLTYSQFLQPYFSSLALVLSSNISLLLTLLVLSIYTSLMAKYASQKLYDQILEATILNTYSDLLKVLNSTFSNGKQATCVYDGDNKIFSLSKSYKTSHSSVLLSTQTSSLLSS